MAFDVGALGTGLTAAATTGFNTFQALEHQKLQRQQQDMSFAQLMMHAAKLPKSMRGPMLDYVGQTYGKAYGKAFNPTFAEMLKKADDEQGQAIAEYVATLTNKTPAEARTLIEAFGGDNPIPAITLLQKGQEITEGRKSEQLLSEALAPPKAAPEPTDERRAFFEGLPQTPGVTALVGDIQGPPVTAPPVQAPPDPLGAVNAQIRRIEGIMPRLRGTEQRAAAQTALTNLREQRKEALTQQGAVYIGRRTQELARAGQIELGDAQRQAALEAVERGFTLPPQLQTLFEKKDKPLRMPADVQAELTGMGVKGEPTAAEMRSAITAVETRRQTRQVDVARQTGLHAAQVPARTPEGQLKNLESLTLAKSYIAELKDLAPKVDLPNIVGGLQPWVNQIKQTGKVGPVPVPPELVGTLTAEQERFLALVQDYADTVLRMRSGAQINEQEFARMLGFLASPSVRPETFIARLTLQDDLLDAKGKAIRAVLEGAGYRVPTLTPPKLGGPRPTATPSKETTVTIGGITIKVRPK